jgi:hypothetical protein
MISLFFVGVIYINMAKPKNGKYAIPKALYGCWVSIIKRIDNVMDKSYHRYGGRGITICDEWRNRYVFFEWAILKGWKRGLQIDRRDNDGNYCPENCRFVTPQQNTLNRKMRPLWGIQKDKKKWRVYIQRNGNRIQIGNFDTIEQAVIARDWYVLNVLKELKRWKI